MTTTTKTDVYREVLRLFQDNECGERLKHPFFQDEFVIASDAYTGVRFKRSLLNTIDFEPHPKAPKSTNQVFAHKSNLNMKLSTLRLRECIDKAKRLESETYEIKKHGNCPDCNGSRLVEWEFESVLGKTIERQFECPTCESEEEWESIYNKKTGYEINDFSSLVNIKINIEGIYAKKNVYFILNRFESIVKTAEMLNKPEIEWCSIEQQGQDDSYMFSHFKVGECEILVMASGKIKDKDNDLITPVEL